MIKLNHHFIANNKNYPKKIFLNNQELLKKRKLNSNFTNNNHTKCNSHQMWNKFFQTKLEKLKIEGMV